MFYMLTAYYFFCEKSSVGNVKEKCNLAETWFAILFTVIMEITPSEVRAVVLGTKYN